MTKFKVITSLFLLNLLLYASACETQDPSPQNVVKENLLGHVWKIKTVSVAGVDNTSSFSGMTILFNETTFNTTNGGSVWPVSGTWLFTSDDGKKVIRNDRIEVSIIVTTTQLDLTLFWPTTTFTGGRSSSVKGNHIFTFTK